MSTTAAQSPPEGGPEVSASAPQDAPPPPASPPATLREDQIQNAVAFLTHPKVQGSLPAAKRSFLERKGLTAAEIEEALRRVPQPSVSAPSAATPAAPFAPAAQQLQTYNGPQLPPQPPPGQQLAVVPAPQPVRWTQVVLGAGVIAAGLYAVKQLVAPHVTSYYHHVVDARRKRQEAAEKREREMHEALLSMRQLQEQLLGSISGLTEVTRELKEQNQVNQYASSRAAAGLLGAGGAGLTTHMNQT